MGGTRRVPWWVLDAALFVGLALVLNAVKWIDGSQASGSLGPLTIDAFYAPYGLAALGILRHVADGAIVRFRPALDASDAEFAEIRARFVNTPMSRVLLALVFGALLSVLSALPAGDLRDQISSSALAFVVVAFVGLIPGTSSPSSWPCAW